MRARAHEIHALDARMLRLRPERKDVEEAVRQAQDRALVEVER